MHILITDSGVGGLSICAYAERYLRSHDIGKPVHLTYVNASPENDYGYNAMGSRDEKLEKFDQFLKNISEKFSPDLIFVACNTLSVLYPDTVFSKTKNCAVRGIVETGSRRLLHELQLSPHSVAAIFGTITTIEEQTYSMYLQSHGIDEMRITSQACPSLADVISEDRHGSKAKDEIEECVAAVISQAAEKADSYLAYLACTHYGYRKVYFLNAFQERGFNAMVLNPNDLVITDLFGRSNRKLTTIQRENEVAVEFITRYKIPETMLETIAYFLDEVSPTTVQAYKNFTYEPDLF